MKSISIKELFIVNKNGSLYMIERAIYVILCLISPYIYAWFTVFGTPEVGSLMHTLMIAIECFFLFNIVFNFFVELEVDGEIMPIRNLQIIAITYLKGSFLFDFVPIIPL